MLEYEISQVIHVLTPFLGNALSMIIGIIIANSFWKGRIYRYANATIRKTLEYQATKIEQLEKEIVDKKEIISDLKGSLKISKIAALKIIEIIQ